MTDKNEDSWEAGGKAHKTLDESKEWKAYMHDIFHIGHSALMQNSIIRTDVPKPRKIELLSALMQI